MRIVDVCPFYTPHGGGVRTYVERKLTAGAAAGHDVIIVAPGPPGQATDARCDHAAVVTLPSPRFPLDRRYRYFADEAALHHMLDRLQPDVVEASSPWSSASMVARWQGHAAKALFLHCDPLAAFAYRWFEPLIERATIDRAFGMFWRHLHRLHEAMDLVVSPSPGLSRRLQAGGLQRLATIPLGVEPGLFSPTLREGALRARLLARCGLGPEATLLIGLGRLSAEKRWPLVVEAVAAAACDHPVGLILLGDGGNRARVIAAVGGNPHVQLLAPIGDRPRLATTLASADALIHGCESETFCLAAAEARASGLPLIVPDRGGAFDQFEHGATWRAASGASLVATLKEYLAGHPEEARRRARAAAGQVASMDEHFARLFAEYDTVHRRRAGARRRGDRAMGARGAG